MNWFLCTNTTMIMPKSWNINYDIGMLNVFHAKYEYFSYAYSILNIT